MLNDFFFFSNRVSRLQVEFIKYRNGKKPKKHSKVPNISFYYLITKRGRTDMSSHNCGWVCSVREASRTQKIYMWRTRIDTVHQRLWCIFWRYGGFCVKRTLNLCKAELPPVQSGQPSLRNPDLKAHCVSVVCIDFINCKDQLKKIKTTPGFFSALWPGWQRVIALMSRVFL